MKKVIIPLSLGLMLAACGNVDPTTNSSVQPSQPDQAAAPYPGAPADALTADLAPIINEGQEGTLEGQYIVVLSDEAAETSFSAQSLGTLSHEALLSSLGIDGQGITIQSVYSQALQGFSATMTEQALSRVRANPAVKYIEKDAVWEATGTEYDAIWGLDRIDQRDLPLNDTYNYAYNGSGVNAYVLDTGVNINHQEFGGRAKWGANTTGDYKNYDCDGHGTHVASTLGGSSVGVAQGVNIVAVKVLNCDGVGSTAGIIDGMEFALNDYSTGRKVLNMSLGPKNRSTSAAYSDAVDALYDANIVTVVAAGNSNDDACYYSPADATNAITVGATNRYDSRSSFSNYGSCLDIFAPGSDILGASPNDNDGYFTISGTSMASPHVAGAVAQLLEQYPNASSYSIAQTLLDNATTYTVSDVAGSPNKLLFTGMGGTAPVDPDPVDPPTNDGYTYTGYLSYADDYAFHPGAEGVYTSGTLKATLSGPANADFDLYLQGWNGERWVNVASSARNGSAESISYNAAEGYYRLAVVSYAGSGDYTLVTN